MNKLIIFDLDGVLIDSKELHFNSLNAALTKIHEKYVITMDEHLSKYDGLSTSTKLKLLSVNTGLDPSLYEQIWIDKQRETLKIIEQYTENSNLIDIFEDIASKNIKIAVASNSIRATVQLSLLKLGILKYIDYFISNEEVSKSKPYPEMYWQCMIRLNSIPNTTVIFEDSHIGREGALNSGAHLIPITNSSDLTFDKIENAYTVLNNTTTLRIPWRDNTMNVLIPMAGLGTRFSQAGYTFPKPLIDVHGKPMIQLVVENLNVDAHYIFLVQKEHYNTYNLKQVLNLISPGCDIIQVDGVTDGAACTTLLAKELINTEQPLLIANSDQFVEWNSNECMYGFIDSKIDGGIITFESTHPKWSYASVGTDGFVDQVAEKNPISNLATVGIYYWKHGSDYVKYAEQMIEKNVRTNNEFYVCPVFNEAISAGKKIKVKNAEKMWGLGTPEDLTYFLNNYKQTR